MSNRHFIALDGMRGLAALAVVVLHLCETFETTYRPAQAGLAVDFFFMLSGFIIAYAYEDKLIRGLSVRKFSMLRIIRLYPMAFVGIILGVAALLTRRAAYNDISLTAIVGATTFALLLLPTPRMSDTPASAFPVNGPLWSIFFELIANLTYALYVRNLTNRLLVFLGVLSFFGLSTVAFYRGDVFVGVAWGWTLPLGLIRASFPFIFGIIIFRSGTYLNQISSLWSLVAAALLIGTLSVPIRNEPIYELISIGVTFPLILILAARANDRGLLTPLWRWIGALSYPIYAINQPVMRLVHLSGTGVSDGATALVFAFIVCIVTSWILLKIFDEPIREWLRQRLIVGNRVGSRPN